MASRRIVLCLDGTWNSPYDENRRDDGSTVLKPTNVLKLARGVSPHDAKSGREQIVAYELGVGSLAQYPGVANRLLHGIDKVLGGAWGAGFQANVENALNFLALNHQPGDEVFVFGFSRGAATARAITHFLDWVGGLPTKRDAYYLPQLFRSYVLVRGEGTGKTFVDAINDKRLLEKVEQRRRPLDPFQAVAIEFLGVWDTVLALGSRFFARGEHTSTAKNCFYLRPQPARCVKHARHALAIDEERYDFRPDIWIGPRDGQILEQRWFSGVHSNIGGGYGRDGLANLAFHWVLDGARERGLEVDTDFTKIYRGNPVDRLYSSSSFRYHLFEGVRLRAGKGKRRLVGQPATAHLSLDPSVIGRLRADPAARKKDEPDQPAFPELQGQPYRPENVLLFLACQPNLDAYLAGLGLEGERRQLPPDVLRRIEELRPRCAKENAAGRGSA